MKENHFEIKDRIAPCGLHCGKCFAYLYGDIHEASVKLKENLGNFEPYAKRFEVQVDPVFRKYAAFRELLDYFSEAQCKGCRKEQCKFYKNCKVRLCSAVKQVEFCYQCPEFPCKNTELDENLYQRHVAINKQIKEIGLEAYYETVKDTPRY